MCVLVDEVSFFSHLRRSPDSESLRIAATAKTTETQFGHAKTAGLSGFVPGG